METKRVQNLMFDTEEDKKKLKEAIEDIKAKKWQSLGRVLFVMKIMFMYTFAFVGFSFLFVYFLLGQNLVCNKQKTDIIFNQIQSQPIIINDSTYLKWCNLDNLYLREQHDKCQKQLNNYTDSCEDYCIKSVFEPICKKYEGVANG